MTMTPTTTTTCSATGTVLAEGGSLHRNGGATHKEMQQQQQQKQKQRRDPDRGIGSSTAAKVFRFSSSLLRWILVDGTLTVLFAGFVFAVVLHRIHDEYLHPQLQLMVFQEENRQVTDTTYYHRVCDEDDFTASSPRELTIEDHFDTDDCVEHMLTHGVSVYPNLLTNETATELRDWIAKENYKRDGWGVIENENRYSWGIDVNMHPAIQTYWEELASNDKLRTALEAIVGPDPAVIEFTAITSSYGATDQYMHADVLPSASAVKYARSFVPSYSLFIPLQDTTYAMGSTHVCPGSHLCGDAEDQCNDRGSFAVSGDEDDDFWAMGSGALLNQQTFHKGMGYTQRGGIDRVLLIATFAPKPNFRKGVETRQIGQGGSYSLLWHQWGHTFSDYVRADKRMTEPQKTFRSLGLIKGNGWNYISTLSMRMANEDTDMRPDSLEDLLEEQGGLWFLPRSWQDKLDEPSDISEYHGWAIGVLKRVEFELGRFYVLGLGGYLAAFGLLVALQRTLGLGNATRRRSKSSIAAGLFLRFVATHGAIVLVAWLALGTVEDSYWAKAIRNRKSFRIPVTESDDPAPGTIPNWADVLSVSQYSSDYLASYAKVIEYAHPGNTHWKAVTETRGPSYASFTPGMKASFCATLVTQVRENRRFLKQDEERFWTEITSTEELIEACDRDLTIASDPMLEAVASQLASLRSETKFGKFRGTVMQTRTMPDYLRRWEDRFFGSSRRESPNDEKDSSSSPTPELPASPKNRSRGNRSRFGDLICSPTAARFESSDAASRHPSSRYLRGPALPPQPQRMEPFRNAWLQEGDRILGWFRCDDEDEQWFPGTITAAIPSEGAYDVLYDDGDTDQGLTEECVRRLDR